MKIGIILFGILVAMNNVNAQTDEYEGKDYGKYIKDVDNLKRDRDRVRSQTSERAGELRLLDAELITILGQIDNFDFSKDIAGLQTLQERADAIKKRSQELARQINADLSALSNQRARVRQLSSDSPRNINSIWPGGNNPGLPEHLQARVRTLYGVDREYGSSRASVELTDEHNDKVALMADIAYNRAAIQKFLNHDVKKLTQEILKASCSQASQCTNNNAAVNNLPRAIDQILDGMQLDNQGQGRSNRSR